jgi:hypothetical protein
VSPVLQCCAEALQHTVQLRPLPVRLSRHAEEQDLTAVIIAGQRSEEERAPLVPTSAQDGDGRSDTICLGMSFRVVHRFRRAQFDPMKSQN